MSVVIRLMRAGAKKRPFYRVVAADSRRQRDGRFLEILGHYDPMSEPIRLKLDGEHVQQWIARGARPSEQVASLLKKAGIELPRPAARQKAEAGAEASPAKKPVKRRVARTVSARKTKKKAARKASKGKPAARKTSKTKAEK